MSQNNRRLPASCTECYLKILIKIFSPPHPEYKRSKETQTHTNRQSSLTPVGHLLTRSGDGHSGVTVGNVIQVVS